MQQLTTQAQKATVPNLVNKSRKFPKSKRKMLQILTDYYHEIEAESVLPTPTTETVIDYLFALTIQLIESVDRLGTHDEQTQQINYAMLPDYVVMWLKEQALIEVELASRLKAREDVYTDPSGLSKKGIERYQFQERIAWRITQAFALAQPEAPTSELTRIFNQEFRINWERLKHEAEKQA